MAKKKKKEMGMKQGQTSPEEFSTWLRTFDYIKETTLTARL